MSEKLACDHTSVGALARDFEGKILLVERKKFPFGWAPPSGHLDGQTYPVACFNGFEEETGLKAIGAPKPLIPKTPRQYFKCRRGGEYHDWQIFEVRWYGELRPNPDETKNTKWFSAKEIKALALRTADYLAKKGQAELLQEELTQAIWRDLDGEWQISPGLEPVWYEFFKELKIIPESV